MQDRHHQAVREQGMSADCPWRCCASLVQELSLEGGPRREGVAGAILDSQWGKQDYSCPLPCRSVLNPLTCSDTVPGQEQTEHSSMLRSGGEMSFLCLCTAPAGHLNTRFMCKGRIYFLSRIILDISTESYNNINFSCALLPPHAPWNSSGSSQLLTRKFSFERQENHDLLLFSPGCGTMQSSYWDHPLYPHKAAAKSLCLFICFMSWILEMFRTCAAGRWLNQCWEGPWVSEGFAATPAMESRPATDAGSYGQTFLQRKWRRCAGRLPGEQRNSSRQAGGAACWLHQPDGLGSLPCSSWPGSCSLQSCRQNYWVIGRKQIPAWAYTQQHTHIYKYKYIYAPTYIYTSHGVRFAGYMNLQ